MRKLIYFLVVLLFLIGISYGYYDDFSGYESYYKLIDDCESLTPQSNTWAVDNTTDAANITVSGAGAKFSKGISWDKSAGGNMNSYIKGDNIYSNIPKDIDSLKNGYLTFWYYIPTGFGTKVTKVEGMLTDSTAITSTTINKTVAYKTGASLDGLNYFKQQLSVQAGNTDPDYRNIKSIRIGIQTSNTGDTASGILIDDIRVVSLNNTTNGVWDESSGIWEILDVSGNKVYYQGESCNDANPPLFTKTTYKDFVYTAKVCSKDSSSQNIGIVFRKSGNYYYCFSLGVSSSSNKIKLMKYAGSFSDLASPVTPTPALSYDTDYYLKVVCVGSSIKAYTSVDGSNYTERFNITDMSLLSPGYIGLLTDKPGYFDDIKVLPIPSGVTASGGDKKVKISWNSYSYSGEIASYNVYRSETSGGPYTKVGTTSSINYTDTDVTNGTTYYYKITANVNVGGTTEETEIDLSSEVSATPHPGIAVSNNPFTPNSSNPAFQRVTFTVYNPTNELIELKVYQPTGVLINTITVNGGSTISWDGTNSSGGVVEGGVYVYQIKVGGSVVGNGSVILAK